MLLGSLAGEGFQHIGQVSLGNFQLLCYFLSRRHPLNQCLFLLKSLIQKRIHLIDQIVMNYIARQELPVVKPIAMMKEQLDLRNQHIQTEMVRVRSQLRRY